MKATMHNSCSTLKVVRSKVVSYMVSGSWNTRVLKAPVAINLDMVKVCVMCALLGAIRHKH